MKTQVAFLFVALAIASPANGAPSDPMELWRRVPHGANMASKNPDEDFRAATGFGITLLRFGATGSPADLTFLVRGEGASEEWDLSETSLRRIRALLDQAAKHRMSAVLTLADIPGRRWVFRQRDCRIWKEPRFQEGFVQAWT